MIIIMRDKPSLVILTLYILCCSIDIAQVALIMNNTLCCVYHMALHDNLNMWTAVATRTPFPALSLLGTPLHQKLYNY